MVQRGAGLLIFPGRGSAAAAALSLIMALTGAVTIVSRGGDDLADRLTEQRGRPAPEADRTTPAAPGEEEVADPTAPAAPGTPRAVQGRGRDALRGEAPAAGQPGAPGTVDPERCRPRPVQETGISNNEIVIGQIVTDVPQLPQQLGPGHEGLRAYLKRVNDAGGVCGRRIRLEYRNDNMNPATHRAAYEHMARNTFAMVGTFSLLDFYNYGQSPPFDPTFREGEFLPDIGGFGFSYNRSQSLWHAGVVGSISPTLVGGGQPRWMVQRAATQGTPCRRGAVVYVREPTGASEDQARLGEVSLRESWGAGLGEGNTRLYDAELAQPRTAYEVMVDRMIDHGMNCVFAYIDLAASVNLVQAMETRGVWPPDSCTRGDQCFRVTYVTLSAYDPQFITRAGNAAKSVYTFAPHVPLNEANHPAMRAYLNDLQAVVPGASPSTFSIFGYASGHMFVQALEACGGAPTRACVMEAARNLRDFDAGGLLGAVTPFRTSRASYPGYGTWDWKWIFNCTVAVQVLDRGGTRDFHRVNPNQGYFCDNIRVARGTPG